MSTEPVRTTCPYCGVGCGVLAGADGTIAGDPAHPANAGRLCSKGRALGETLSLEGRLLRPEVDGVAVAWDAALDVVAARFAATVAEHGPGSVALYVSGQLLTEDYYAANKFAKSVLVTANIDSNSRLCMASAVAGHRRAFGEDVVPCVYEDLELADLVVLVGSNTAWCHPVLFQRLIAAREARPGLRIVVIDPRRTATCEDADLHLALQPGSDVALFAGLLADLATRGLVGGRFGEAGAAVAAARAACPDAARTAAACGLDEGLVATFFQWVAETPRVVTMFSQGVNQSSAGTDKVNAILNVHLATGRMGSPGMGPFSVTGQPNAMGGREVGALATTLAAHLEYDREGDAALLAAAWGVAEVPRRAGLKAVELFQAVGDGRIRALWIIGTNPAVSLPDGNAVRAALAACPFVVVSECVRESDTVDYADVRLPALAWGEKDGTVTNSERVISRQRTFLPVPGEARPDWWMIAQVAARLGHGARFGWQGTADIFREHAALSALGHRRGGVFDIAALSGLDDAGYAALAPVRWPVGGDVRLFGDGRFPTANGRARLVPTVPRGAAVAVSAEWPLVLLTGRVRDQWHTMTRTGKAARLMAHRPEPQISIHPGDAQGLANGDLAEVASPFGSAVLRVRLDGGLRPGSVFAPMHWTARFCGAARVNAAVNPAFDPISGQPELKHTPVRVARFVAGWHGFVLSRDEVALPGAWQARVPIAGGHRYELAGMEAPDVGFELVRAAFSDGGWMTLRDGARGQYRAVAVAGDRLVACVFVAATPDLPARDWLAGLFAGDAALPAVRRALLAGHQPGGSVEPPVCVCHGVGAGVIRAAVHGGCGDVAAIGVATKAGTGCGSCRPELRALLASEMLVSA